MSGAGLWRRGNSDSSKLGMNGHRCFEEMARNRREEEALADELRNRFEAGEEELADLETLLDERSGDLKDVFTAVNQVAADARAVRAELHGFCRGGRSQRAAVTAWPAADSLPSAADLQSPLVDPAGRDA